MNKEELIAEIAHKTNGTKADAQRFVNGFCAVITEELAANRKIKIRGFGTFEVRTRAARKWKNPHSGKIEKVSAAKVPAFKAGKELKKHVNA